MRSNSAWSFPVQLCILAILLGLGPTVLRAQQPDPPLVLLLPASVRSAGLAGAGVALLGDAGAVFRNPAGLATLRYASLEASYHSYPDNTFHATAALGTRLGPFNLGVGGNYLKFSDSSAVRDNLLWVGTGGVRRGIFSLGFSLKYVSTEDTTSRVNRATTSDLGLAIALFDISSIAFSVQNINNQRITGDRLTLPTRYRLGYMLNFVDPQTTARLLGTIEVIWTEGQERRTVGGIEAGAVVSGVGIVLRAGHGGQPLYTNQSEWSWGGGVVLGGIGIDYAFQKRTGLGGQVHRVGVRFRI